MRGEGEEGRGGGGGGIMANPGSMEVIERGGMPCDVIWWVQR